MTLSTTSVAFGCSTACFEELVEAGKRNSQDLALRRKLEARIVGAKDAIQIVTKLGLSSFHVEGRDVTRSHSRHADDGL